MDVKGKWTRNCDAQEDVRPRSTPCARFRWAGLVTILIMLEIDANRRLSIGGIIDIDMPLSVRLVVFYKGEVKE
jgi:hypothetical protein